MGGNTLESSIMEFLANKAANRLDLALDSTIVTPSGVRRGGVEDLTKFVFTDLTKDQKDLEL